MIAANRLSTTLVLEPGSFRDWDARVFVSPDAVFRALTEAGVADWEALAGSDFYAELTENGALVATETAADDILNELRRLDPDGHWQGALRHERLPFISYPYEWPFSMLQDAALLQLRITKGALAEGLMLKDATPYNVQRRGSQPVSAAISA